MPANTGSTPDGSQNIEKSLESNSATSRPQTPPSPSVNPSVHHKKRRRTSSPRASLQQDTAVGAPGLSRSRRPTYRQHNDSFGPPLGGVTGSLRSSASFIGSVTGRPLRQKDVSLTQHSGWVSRKGLPATAERHRMLTGQLYTYLEVSLGQDRARCERALERYNHVSRPASGFSSAETMLSLTQIVDPSEDTLNPSRNLNVTECAGSIGTNTIIEPPFRCSYGYNLRIGDQVFISKDASFDDSAVISIGSRCSIGSRVRIITSGIDFHLENRTGVGALYRAQSVTIGADVVIGDDVCIAPGVVIGQGSHIEPFAIVRKLMPVANLTKLAAREPPQCRKISQREAERAVEDTGIISAPEV